MEKEWNYRLLWFNCLVDGQVISSPFVRKKGWKTPVLTYSSLGTLVSEKSDDNYGEVVRMAFRTDTHLIDVPQRFLVGFNIENKRFQKRGEKRKAEMKQEKRKRKKLERNTSS